MPLRFNKVSAYMLTDFNIFHSPVRGIFHAQGFVY